MQAFLQTSLVGGKDGTRFDDVYVRNTDGETLALVAIILRDIDAFVMYRQLHCR